MFEQVGKMPWYVWAGGGGAILLVVLLARGGNSYYTPPADNELRQDMTTPGGANVEGFYSVLEGFNAELVNMRSETRANIDDINSAIEILNRGRENDLKTTRGMNYKNPSAAGQSMGSYISQAMDQTRDYGNNGVGTQEQFKENEFKLNNDPIFLGSEMTRTDRVISNRKAAGLDTSVQERYKARLQTGSYSSKSITTNTAGMG